MPTFFKTTNRYGNIMKFAQWLESQNSTNIVFGSFFKDGTVTVYIDGARYVYITDAVYHDRWDRTLKYIKRERPQAYRKVAFGILNQIKDMIKKGYATQEEPKPSSVTPPTPEPPAVKKPVQKTLF